MAYYESRNPSGLTQTNLIEMLANHIPDTPALVPDCLSDLFQELILGFRRGQRLNNGNKVFHRQETNRILIISL